MSEFNAVAHRVATAAENALAEIKRAGSALAHGRTAHFHQQATAEAVQKPVEVEVEATPAPVEPVPVAPVVVEPTPAPVAPVAPEVVPAPVVEATPAVAATPAA
jgi:hypothetical protein